tara:strand:- start:833 stop:1666 length:834 start_codon:yes stop_codon:yes gene_type:complete
MEEKRMNLGNVALKGNIKFEENHKAFPENPEEGELALVNGTLHLYTRDEWWQLMLYTKKKGFFQINDSKEKETESKLPERGVFKDLYTEKAEIGNLRWTSDWWDYNDLPPAHLHSGMVTLLRKEKSIVYSNGNVWKYVTTEDNKDELLSSVNNELHALFQNINYNQIKDTPDLNNVTPKWKNIQEIPDLGNNTYKGLTDKPVLVYSDEIDIDTIDRESGLVEFKRDGEWLNLDRDWLQIFIDGCLINPSKYKNYGSYGITFNNFIPGEYIQAVTLKT